MMWCSETARLLIVLLLVCFQLYTVTSERLTGCPLSKLQIVTFNKTLLPQTVNNIRAQIRFANGPNVPPSIVNYGPNHTNVYCAPDIDEAPRPRIVLEFIQPVVVVGIISGGYTYQVSDPDLDGIQEYVSRFTLETSLEENSTNEYVLYNASQTEGDTEFVINEDNVDRFILLNEPFMARRVRLRIIEKIETQTAINITCWSLALFGCLSSEALYDEDNERDPPQISSPVTGSETSSVAHASTTNSETGQTQTVSTAMILTIVLPVALLTVLSVMVIVVVGVLICIKSSHEKTGGKVGDESEGRERAVTLNLVQNEIYDSPTEKRQADHTEGYSPILQLHNPIDISPTPNETEFTTADIDANYSLVDHQIYSVPKSSLTESDKIPLRRNASYGMGKTRAVRSEPQQSLDRESKVYENIPEQLS